MTAVRFLLAVSLLTGPALLPMGCSQAPAAPQTLKLEVKGMTCEGCVQGITSSLNDLPGVTSCTVSLEKEHATVEINVAAIQPAQILKRLEQMGYEARLEPAAAPAGT
jgi:Cu+-exporting ATPase